MSNTPPDNAVEQRRKVLKGALAASGVVTMGYSGPALASFQCVTSTTQDSKLPGFKKTLGTNSSWAWLRLEVFGTNKKNGSDWKAVKIPSGSNPSVAGTDSGTTVYYYDDLATEPRLYTVAQLPSSASGIQLNPIEANKYVYVIIYFTTDGSIAGFFPTYLQSSGTGYPAQGSCLTSLNPNMVQTNIFYGG